MHMHMHGHMHMCMWRHADAHRPEGVACARTARVTGGEREQRPSAWRCVAFRAHVHVYLQFTRTMGITMGTNFTGRLGRRRRLYTRTFA